MTGKGKLTSCHSQKEDSMGINGSLRVLTSTQNMHFHRVSVFTVIRIKTDNISCTIQYNTKGRNNRYAN